jgi:hypothetical protein
MRYNFIVLILIGLSLIGCATTAPLPATLNIVPPAQDVAPEIAAFSGIWEGKWKGQLDSILVVEKINTETAEVILSIGKWFNVKSWYSYSTAKVLPGSAIEWTNPKGDKFIFTMDKGLNKIYGTLVEKKTGANFWAYFHRRIVK